MRTLLNLVVRLLCPQ